MFKSGLVSVFACVLMCVSCTSVENKTLLEDDFNRDNADKLANGWKVYLEGEAKAEIVNNVVRFNARDGEYTPAISHAFAEQSSGIIELTFDLDWICDYETNYAIFIQLGNSKKMTDTDMDKGVAVNLAWGGGSNIFKPDLCVLAHIKNWEFNVLGQLNDSNIEETIPKDPKMTVTVDLDKKTYTVKIGDNTYKNLAFDKDLPIDTFRFVAHGTNADNFSKKSIDNVKVIKK